VSDRPAGLEAGLAAVAELLGPDGDSLRHEAPAVRGVSLEDPRDRGEA
jgi:hypothetical protein